MQHGPAVELKTDYASKKKSTLGLILFAVYSVIYGGFVAIGTVSPHLMGSKVLGGQNLAVVYGFGLIILAILMGLAYNYACTKMENKLNEEEV